MAKRVLGNDPFQRSAAEPAAPEPPAAKRGRKPAAKKAPAKRTAPGKGAAPAPGAEPRENLAVEPVHAAGAAAPSAEQLAAMQLAGTPPTYEIADPEPPAPAQERSVAARAELPPATPSAEPGAAPTAGPAVEPAAALARASLAPGARRVSQADFAERAGGVLRLARDMAVHALASEGVGRALGVAQGLLGAVRAGLGTGGSRSLDLYGKDPALVGELRPVLDFLYERYWRVSVQGAELVPTGPVVLVANHSGALPFDGPVMQLALVRERPELAEARWLVEDQIFHAPVLGTLFNRLGAVRACQENAARLLDEGRPLVVFPEGIQGLSKPFAQRYQLKRFGRGGFVKLALRSGAPIVPVAIVGAEESSPLLARLPGAFLGLPYLPLTPLGPLPLPAKWSIRFGAPLELGGAGPAAAEDPGEVQRLTERTRDSIQGMLQAMLQKRRSVFGG